MRRFKGYRTVIVNILTTVLPITALAQWQDVIPAQYWPYYILFVAILNIVLRSITTTPVGVGEDDGEDVV
jgi:hypothetical protein